jgi:hypothetical protein
MEIAKHTHATVVVSSEWRNVGAVKLLIGALKMGAAPGCGIFILRLVV